jgi:hypothetical protein
MVAAMLLVVSSSLPSLGRAASAHVFFDIQPARFHKAAQGQPSTNGISITNLMNDPVTVSAVMVKGASKAFAVSDSFSLPVTLAAGERFEIPISLFAKKGRGKARLQILALTPKSHQVAIEYLKFHYEVR